MGAASSNSRWVILKQYRSSRPEVLGKGVLKICSKFKWEHPCRRAISKLYWNRTSRWVFSCKSTAFFQNTVYSEHIWRAASYSTNNFTHFKLSVPFNFNQCSKYFLIQILSAKFSIHSLFYIWPFSNTNEKIIENILKLI